VPNATGRRTDDTLPVTPVFASPVLNPMHGKAVIGPSVTPSRPTHSVPWKRTWTTALIDGEIMFDPTETIRRERQAELAANAGPRADLEARYGQIWDTDQLREEFEVIGFMAPLVVVRRLSDGQKGSLEFQGNPRFYFSFEPHKP
jgi:hypothetical protein